MKNIWIGLLIIAPITILLYLGCDTPNSPTSVVSGKDTLYTTIVRRDTTRYPFNMYRLISEKATNTFDTIYSETTPPTSTMSTFGSTGNCSHFYVPIWTTISRKVDTLYRIVDNPTSRDTIFIFDTLNISHVVYNDTINSRIDTVEAYRKNNKPYFSSKDSIATILSNPLEGNTQYILLPAFHFDNDSATIRLIDNPSWAKLKWISVNEGYGDCLFYPKCVNGSLAYNGCPYWISKKSNQLNSNDCSKPYLVFEADSTALDSTYQWKVIITNKYNLSDTIKVSSRVTPFPYSKSCESQELVQ